MLEINEKNIIRIHASKKIKPPPPLDKLEAGYQGGFVAQNVSRRYRRDYFHFGLPACLPAGIPRGNPRGIRPNAIRRKFQIGFTLIELMVVVTIAVSITGIILAQFKIGEQSRNVRIASDDVQSALRLMQNNILSGVLSEVGPPPTPAKDFGWKIDMTTPTQHVTFVENPTGAMRVLETLKLPPQVAINNLKVNCSGLCLPNAAALEVRFFPPFGAMEFHFRDLVGSWATIQNGKASFDVQFGSSSQKRTISIDGISGRISVQ